MLHSRALVNAPDVRDVDQSICEFFSRSAGNVPTKHLQGTALRRQHELVYCVSGHRSQVGSERALRAISGQSHSKINFLTVDTRCSDDLPKYVMLFPHECHADLFTRCPAAVSSRLFRPQLTTTKCYGRLPLPLSVAVLCTFVLSLLL